MGWLTFCLPLILGMHTHNTVDFRDFGAQERYVNYLDYTVTEFVEMVEKYNRIRLVSHSGQMDERIHHLTLNFEAKGGQTIDGARDMILGLVNTFLDALNHGCCGRLPPFLCPNPFSGENVDMQIHFVGDCLYNYPLPQAIQFVSFSGGKIGYFTQDPGLCGGVHQIRSEPLDLALALAQPPHMINCPTFPKRCRFETLKEFLERKGSKVPL